MNASCYCIYMIVARNEMTTNMTWLKVTSISANTDGPCNAALLKIDNIMHTEYNYQAMSIGR